MKRPVLLWIASLLFLLLPCVAPAQQAPPQPPKPSSSAATSEEFLRAADEVMADVSKLLSLPVKSPLKKFVRSKDEVREYLLRQLKEQKNPKQMEIDQKVKIRFGLLPKGFQLESFLVDLLTDQIAGLYDPKTQEFYISDTVDNPLEVRMIMAHELTHALQDQHFKVDKWREAAKPNDDAELARQAVVEGSATAAMFDYLLRGQTKISIATMPDLGPLIQAQMGVVAEKNDKMASAPPFIQDSLLFPYLSGAVFTQRVLRSVSTWEEFHKRVFSTPPVSTQQILHPDLYLAGVAPQPVTIPDLKAVFPPAVWEKIDENLMGEFGLQSLLKQFLSEERASRRSPEWAGDRYAAFENKKTGRLVLLYRLRLESEEAAARFFGAYSEALELKYAAAKPTALFRRPSHFQFGTIEGGVFLRCHLDQCLTVEGVSRRAFDRIVSALRWPASPAVPVRPTKAPAKTAEKTIHHRGTVVVGSHF